MPALSVVLFGLHPGVSHLEWVMGEVVLGHSRLIKHGVCAVGFEIWYLSLGM